MPADLAALRAALTFADPGPWTFEPADARYPCGTVTSDDGHSVAVVERPGNGPLIAAAPQLAALCDEVEQLRAERAGILAWLGDREAITDALRRVLGGDGG